MKASTACAVEHYHAGVRYSATAAWFLGDDLPCHSRCADTSFFERCLHSMSVPATSWVPVEARDGDHCENLCSGCPAMQEAKTALNLSNHFFNRDWIKLTSSHRVAYIVIGTGAWWNLNNGIEDPIHAYSGMLTRTEAVLRRLVDAGKRVVWMGLTPSARCFVGGATTFMRSTGTSWWGVGED